MMRDMSEEGFALRAMIPVQAGEKTPFSFLLDTDVRIEGQGEILWVKENGRVAGVRFLEIPSLARRQIRSWLTGTLDTLETPESAEEPAAPEAQSFDELRKELRTPAPRPKPAKPHWVVPRTAPPKTVPEVPAAVPDVTPQGMPAGVLAEAAVDSPRAQDTEPPADAGAFPGLPNFSATQEAIEHTFEALPPAPLPVQNAAPAPPLVVPGVRATVAEENIASPAKPGLPDISAILMQPRRKEREFSASVPALEPLDPLGHSHGVSQSGRPWFTFSRAVAVMILLALAVGIYAYRQPAGQFLIWLGGQLGGTQASQTASPASNDGVSASDANPPSSNPSEPSAPAPNAAAAGGNQESAGHSKSSGQAALPSTEKSSLPQVTPFSPLPPEQTGQETGLTEYSRAMQLLHGTHSDADTSEAVRLLWISVEKGNPSAELTLAELYWHGQGVGRNCDQARILLSAAARKGNADAQRGLKRIQQEGCE
jgi:PilZ domain